MMLGVLSFDLVMEYIPMNVCCLSASRSPASVGALACSRQDALVWDANLPTLCALRDWFPGRRPQHERMELELLFGKTLLFHKMMQGGKI